ncbi:MAG: phosphoribosylformylglycinamidine cyclo-ligase [Candidatus Omnitrophota bacterium]
MGLSYKRAGVDTVKAGAFVESIKELVHSGLGAQSQASIGGFGACYDLAGAKHKNPMLVSSCDGVGTKLKIAIASGIHDTVGIDLVAMSVNDVLCTGAKPLFFLDYIATGKVKPPVLKDVVKGVIAGCREADCLLVGGETAEMPGMYKPGDYDLAGFCVGIMDRSKVLGAKRVGMGDAVIGLSSSGLHSNGFSLVRKVFSVVELKSRASELLTPTRIYVKPVLKGLAQFNAKNCNIKAIAHITGGGFYEKALRVVPAHMTMIIYKNAWVAPEIFSEIQQRGKMNDKEMFRTFNMGIGMILVVKDKIKMDVVRAFSRYGVKSYLIGEIVSGVGSVTVV